LIEKTEPMKQKALLISERIAQKAREWKVISPDVMASLQVVSSLRSGVELPGRVVNVSETDVLKFPWAELPRWVDLNADQLAYTEWSLTDRQLQSQLVSQSRGEGRRAAFVKLLREGSTRNPEVKKWVKTFVDRAGVQLRVQAMIQDGELQRAGLFLDQYESFFGADAFSDHHWGRLEWARGNYTQAYLRWVRTGNEVVAKDFRSAYWSEGWNTLLDSLVEGHPSASTQREVFAKLAPLAKDKWQRHALLKLCLDQQAKCEGEFSFEKMAPMISAAPEAPVSYKAADGRSAFGIQKALVSSYVLAGVHTAQTSEQIELLHKALTGLYNLSQLTDRAQEDVYNDYWMLRKSVDERQDRIDANNKKRVLAGAGS
jgi:hypothetical protein